MSEESAQKLLVEMEARGEERRRIAKPFVDFAASLCPVALQESGNRLVSPASLYLALSMVALAARGEMEGELMGVLGHDGRDGLVRCCSDVYSALCPKNKAKSEPKDDEGMGDAGRASGRRRFPTWHPEDMSIENLLLVNDGLEYGVSEEYAELIADAIGGVVKTCDFADGGADGALTKMCGNGIDGFLDAHVQVAPDAPMTIANLVHYRGKWHDEFRPELTESGVFHAPDGDVEAEFMHRDETSCKALRCDGYTYAEKSLGRCTMSFFLPDEDVDVHELVATPEKTAGLFSVEPMKDVYIHWSVPKFDVSVGESDVAGWLREMGVEHAFVPSTDFADVLTSPDADKAYVSGISQDARLSIDEEGCEAAALTISQFACFGMMPRSDELDFVLDRPFLFALRNQDNGVPLFVGIVEHPW